MDNGTEHGNGNGAEGAVAVMDRAPQSRALEPIPLDGRGLVIADHVQAMRFCQFYAASNLAPSWIQKWEDAFVVYLKAKALGLDFMTAVDNMALINGVVAVWGDLPLALVEDSGLLEDHSETDSGTYPEDSYTWTCVVKRKGRPSAVTVSYSIADAKETGLWDKWGKPRKDKWGNVHPSNINRRNQVRVRARQAALRIAFPDVLKGMRTKDEAEDNYIDVSVSAEPVEAAPANGAAGRLAERLGVPAEPQDKGRFVKATPAPTPEPAPTPAPEPKAPAKKPAGSVKAEDYTAAIREGREAFAAGLKAGANPYTANSTLQAGWSLGYDQGIKAAQEDPEREGYLSAFAGVPADGNPYSGDTAARKLWSAGWTQGDRERNNPAPVASDDDGAPGTPFDDPAEAPAVTPWFLDATCGEKPEEMGREAFRSQAPRNPNPFPGGPSRQGWWKGYDMASHEAMSGIDPDDPDAQPVAADLPWDEGDTAPARTTEPATKSARGRR